MKTLRSNGRTFPLEVAVAHYVALPQKQCVPWQESRAQRVATVRVRVKRLREQSLARATGAQYMCRVAADH
jgi:hypothetical protein